MGQGKSAPNSAHKTESGHDDKTKKLNESIRQEGGEDWEADIFPMPVAAYAYGDGTTYGQQQQYGQAAQLKQYGQGDSPDTEKSCCERFCERMMEGFIMIGAHVVFLIGVLIVAASVTTWTSDSFSTSSELVTQSGGPDLLIVVIVALIFGILTVICSCCGCVGAYKENNVCLGGYCCSAFVFGLLFILLGSYMLWDSENIQPVVIRATNNICLDPTALKTELSCGAAPAPAPPSPPPSPAPSPPDPNAAKCTEKATTSVAADKAACEAVTALADSTACDAVKTAADASSAACTYTPKVIPATCKEKATTSVAADKAACEAVTALADSTACTQVMTAADASTAACTYTAASNARLLRAWHNQSLEMLELGEPLEMWENMDLEENTSRQLQSPRLLAPPPVYVSKSPKAKFVKAFGKNGCPVVDKVCAPNSGFTATSCACSGQALGTAEQLKKQPDFGTYCNAWDIGGSNWCYVADGVTCGSLPVASGGKTQSAGPCGTDVVSRSQYVVDGLGKFTWLALWLILDGIIMLVSACCAIAEMMHVCHRCFGIGKKPKEPLPPVINSTTRDIQLQPVSNGQSMAMGNSFSGSEERQMLLPPQTQQQPQQQHLPKEMHAVQQHNAHIQQQAFQTMAQQPSPHQTYTTGYSGYHQQDLGYTPVMQQQQPMTAMQMPMTNSFHQQQPMTAMQMPMTNSFHQMPMTSSFQQGGYPVGYGQVPSTGNLTQYSPGSPMQSASFQMSPGSPMRTSYQMSPYR